MAVDAGAELSGMELRKAGIAIVFPRVRLTGEDGMTAKLANVISFVDDIEPATTF